MCSLQVIEVDFSFLKVIWKFWKLKIIIPASIWVGSITEITNSMSVLSSEKKIGGQNKKHFMKKVWMPLNELWTNFERTFQAISKQSYFCFISFISLTRKTGLDISYLVGTRDGFSLSFPWDWICFVFFTEFLSFLTTRLTWAAESLVLYSWNNDN